MSEARAAAVLAYAAQQPAGLRLEWAAYERLGCCCEPPGAETGGAAAGLRAPGALHGGSGSSAGRGGGAQERRRWRAACGAANALGFPAALACGQLVMGLALSIGAGGAPAEPPGWAAPPGAPSGGSGRPACGGAAAGAQQPPGEARAQAQAPEHAQGQGIHLHWLVTYLVIQYAAAGDLGPRADGPAAALRGGGTALAGAGVRALRALRHLHRRGLVHRDVKVRTTPSVLGWRGWPSTVLGVNKP